MPTEVSGHSPSAELSKLEVLILTNFMNSPCSLTLPDGDEARIVCADGWPEVRERLSSADLVVIDCRDLLLYRIAARFLIFPWTRRPLVAVDLVLRKPKGLRANLNGWMKRVLFSRVDHFIHYFKDIGGYTKYFRISAEQAPSFRSR